MVYECESVAEEEVVADGVEPVAEEQNLAVGFASADGRLLVRSCPSLDQDRLVCECPESVLRL